MRLLAYGLAVECAVSLPGALAARSGAGAGAPALTVTAGDVPVRLDRIAARAERRVDGRAFTVERAATGDVLMRWGDEDRFHLAGTQLTAWSAGEPDSRWQRVLLDSVLASATLALGAEALHAGAVEVDGAAVAVAAGPGGGKSSVLAELVARGHRLIADDVTVLDAGLHAHPAPPVLALARDRPAGSVPPSRVGRVLAELDGEAWIAVEHAAAVAVPLKSVVLLERTARATEPSVRVLEASPLALLPFLLESGDAPERVLARFDRASAAAARAAVLRLRVPLECTPRQLAALVLEAADVGR